ncbi:hypothetical protein Tco_0801885 [Tanacetum coccineum]|uniref:Uncharacterized protein n=1 Tax=Tanacetum coccineum TaxID=301880 RepID=A0ABQ5A1F6_9ASTR
MINELDRSNEMINKHMAEYEEAENDLTIEEKIELITELINYQKDFARIKKYQAQQQRLASKFERRKFYTSVLRSHAGWKTKDLRGMTFNHESLKRSGILVEKVKAKRLKTSDVSAQEQQESDNQDEIINLQQWAVLVKEETSVNITPSVVKVPICDWKIYKDKLREVYQIFRVGQASNVYPYFESMLKDFDRDDLVTLWKLVKDRFDSWYSTHLYSNPNADSNRMPLTKAKGQIPQKDKIHKIESMIKRFRKRYSRVVCPNEAAIESNPGLMRN